MSYKFGGNSHRATEPSIYGEIILERGFDFSPATGKATGICSIHLSSLSPQFH